MSLPLAVRALVRDRGLSLAVLVTLALGVGALTVAFGIVNAALFRQPPFEDARRLAMLYIVRNPVGEPTRRERWSFGRIELLREAQKSYERVAWYTPSTLMLAGHRTTLLTGVNALLVLELRAGGWLGDGTGCSVVGRSSPGTGQAGRGRTVSTYYDVRELPFSGYEPAECSCCQSAARSTGPRGDPRPTFLLRCDKRGVVTCTVFPVNPLTGD